MVSRPTRAQLVARCAALGVELVAEGHDRDLEALCPPGLRFAGPQVHMLRVATEGGRRWRMADAYAAMLEDLQGGVEPCQEQDCDYCKGEEQ